jgi:hypothetical protein
MIASTSKVFRLLQLQLHSIIYLEATQEFPSVSITLGLIRIEGPCRRGTTRPAAAFLTIPSTPRLTHCNPERRCRTVVQTTELDRTAMTEQVNRIFKASLQLVPNE